MKKPVLEVKNLTTSFETENGKIFITDNISFELYPDSALGIVGESGCGKSVTALSIMRLLPRPFGRIEKGRILFGSDDIVSLPPQKLSQIRGSRISMIFQEPMTALNPVHKIGRQIKEALKIHRSELSEKDKHCRCVKMLDETGIADPEKRMEEYPHMISGGMRQRVMIAMALICKPDILIADEPTTALDVTIQAQVLDIIKALQKKTKMAIIFITHDLGVISELCDQVIVMYAGKIAEKAATRDLFANPKHPYTKGLLDSIPDPDAKRKTFLKTIEGRVPGFDSLPTGCRFANRCSYVSAICKTGQPPEIETEKGHFVSCFQYASTN